MKKKLALLFIGAGMLSAFGGSGTAFAAACNDGPTENGAELAPIPDVDGTGPGSVYGDQDFAGSGDGYLGVQGGHGFIELTGNVYDVSPRVDGTTSPEAVEGDLNKDEGLCLNGGAVQSPSA